MKADKDIIYNAMIHLMTRMGSSVEKQDWALDAAIKAFKTVYGREPIGIGQKD